MNIEELNAKIDELNNKITHIETEKRLKDAQNDESIGILMQMFDKLKSVIGKLPEAITDNQTISNRLVHKTRKLAEQQRDLTNSFIKITSRFEQNVIDAIDAQREMIYSIVSEKIDNNFDEAIKTLIVETQKNEVNKAIEKALKDFGGATSSKVNTHTSNTIKLLLVGASSFFLVIGLIFLAIRFL